MNWDFEKNVHYVHFVILFLRWNGLFSSFTCFSCCHRWLFPSTGWCFLLVLRIVFWCLRRDRVSFNMLWCWFITFCVAFYSCLHLRGIRGRQPDRQVESSVEAYWCGRKRCLELIGETSLFFLIFLLLIATFFLIILIYINIYDYFYLL